MKRFMMLIAVAMMAAALALAGCSAGPSPSDVTKGALDALKAQDMEALQSYNVGNVGETQVGSVMGSLGVESGDELTDAQKAQREKLLAVFTDFDYVLGEEKIDGDKATVEATITTHDMSRALGEALTEYLQQAFGMAFSGASQDDLSILFGEIFLSKLDPSAEKTHVGITTFNLTKVDGEWKLDKLSDDNIDCLLGGLTSALKDTGNSLNSMANNAK